MPALPTFGIEEEFLVVDELTARSITAEPLLDGTNDALVSELNDCCVEWNSPVFTETSDLLDAAVSVRRELVATAMQHGRRVFGVGMHPIDDEGASIAPDPRHERLSRRYPWAATRNVAYGLHVHVGMPSMDAAVRVSDAMRPLVPILVACGANSPVRDLEAVGAMSTRMLTTPLFPRTGPPPVFGDAAGLDDYLDRLARQGVIRDYRDCWWLVRPHPKWCTVEFRMFDAQSDPYRAVRLASLVRLLAMQVHEHGDLLPPVEDDVLSEEIVTAARDGFHGTLYREHLHGVRIGDALRELVQPLLADHPDGAFLQPLLDVTGPDVPPVTVDGFLRTADLAAHVDATSDVPTAARAAVGE